MTQNDVLMSVTRAMTNAQQEAVDATEYYELLATHLRDVCHRLQHSQLRHIFLPQKLLEQAKAHEPCRCVSKAIDRMTELTTIHYI